MLPSHPGVRYDYVTEFIQWNVGGSGLLTGLLPQYLLQKTFPAFFLFGQCSEQFWKPHVEDQIMSASLGLQMTLEISYFHRNGIALDGLSKKLTSIMFEL